MTDIDIPSLIARLENHKASLFHGGCADCYASAMDDAAEVLSSLTKPRPISEYHEDMGDVLWWTFPIKEPPYVGSPLDLGHTVTVRIVDSTGADNTMTHNVGGWPGYHTHFTPLPPIPSLPQEEKQ